MIPGNALSTVPRTGSFLYPDSRLLQMTKPAGDTTSAGRCLTATPRDWELAGYAINDPSRGLDYQTWQFWLDEETGYVNAGPDPDGPWTALLWAPWTDGITELSGAFDTEMRPAFASMSYGLMRLWWYDPLVSSYATLDLSGCTSPRLTLDDKRANQAENADMLLFYLREGSLYYRQQRDRFETERLLCVQPIGTLRLGRVGMATSNRVQVEFLTT